MKNNKIKVITGKPFWVIECEYAEERNNFERECWEAKNLWEAILCGANMTRLDRGGEYGTEQVGYMEEDGEIQLYGDYETYTDEQLEEIEVEFETLDRDDDGYTIAIFKRVKEK